MSAKRLVYSQTAMMAELVVWLRTTGHLDVESDDAALDLAVRFCSVMARHYGWPENWRDLAHVDLGADESSP